MSSSNQAKGKEIAIEPLKKAVTTAMRAISGDGELEVVFAADRPSLNGHKARVPDPPRLVDRNRIQTWMAETRRTGAVGVVMRVNSTGEKEELALLPTDGKRYAQGKIVILIFPQVAP